MTEAPGLRLLAAVEVMDRLRSPGGCPWDQEQTHESLVPYALEEAYEVADAVDREDWTGLRDELGDLLLQVLFHARVAEERPGAEGGFSVDDVADALIAKLVRRHPHVFADVTVSGSDEVHVNWEEIKRAERAAAGSADTPGRELSSALRRIPRGMPPTLAGAKVLRRIAGAGFDVGAIVAAASAAVPGGAALGEALAAAVGDGLDADAGLRAWVRAAIEAAEALEEDHATAAGGAAVTPETGENPAG